MSADKCSCSCFSIGLGLVLFFERKREMMLEIEKPCCEELDGSTTAIVDQTNRSKKVMVACAPKVRCTSSKVRG
jgi:hypothetical protein